MTLHHGDCLDVLPSLDAASVDAVVTDPPYGLGFMGKDWDSPGGTGDFPMRRFDAINTVNTGASRQGGRQRSCDDFTKRQARDARSYQEWCEAWAAECLRVLKPGGHLLAFGGTRTAHRLTTGIEDAGFELRDSISWLYGSGFPKSLNLKGEWQGWGTALKPAHEPIVVARKSPVGTVAANVLEFGTGALNIDACRVGFASKADEQESKNKNRHADFGTASGGNEVYGDFSMVERTNYEAPGRWPTNVVLDETQAEELDKQSGTTAGRVGMRQTDGPITFTVGEAIPSKKFDPGVADFGGASRFFPTFRYEPKAPTTERPRNGSVAHPTVKPLDLMRWLIRLVTPPGGLVLDPFLGSGTTAEACIVEGFNWVGIEREADYLPLIEARLSKPLQAVMCEPDAA